MNAGQRKMVESMQKLREASIAFSGARGSNCALVYSCASEASTGSSRALRAFGL
jgi:hypothetical protein